MDVSMMGNMNPFMGQMAGMGNFNSAMLGIEQYEQNAGKAESEDMVSTLLEALYEDDEVEDTDTESLLSINTSA